MNNLLSIITVLPAIAALILALFLRGTDEAAQRNAKMLALIATTATFVIPPIPGFSLSRTDLGSPG